jgi:hypothetical protein
MPGRAPRRFFPENAHGRRSILNGDRQVRVKPKEKEEDDIDVASVFAKLKQLKTTE